MRLPVDINALGRALGATVRRHNGATLTLPGDCMTWLGSDPGHPLRTRYGGDDAADELPSAWILGFDQTPPQDGVPVLATDSTAPDLRYRVGHFLDQQLLPRLVPGTMSVVNGVGVLIRGPAGSGKSQTALELLDRGHSLISDDTTELHPGCRQRLEARAPGTTAGLLHLRALGTVSVSDHYPGQLRTTQPLHLVVTLDPEAGSSDPLKAGWTVVGLMGRCLPCLRLVPGRLSALLIELAAREVNRNGSPSTSVQSRKHTTGVQRA